MAMHMDRVRNAGGALVSPFGSNCDLNYLTLRKIQALRSQSPEWPIHPPQGLSSILEISTDVQLEVREYLRQ